MTKREPFRGVRHSVAYTFGGGHSDPAGIASALRDMADYLDTHHIDVWDIEAITFIQSDGLWHIELVIPEAVDERRPPKPQ